MLGLPRVQVERNAGGLGVLAPTTAALEATLADFVDRRLPHRRVARLAGLLLLSGLDPAGSWHGVGPYLVRARHADGGWVDCEDTAWCSYVLRRVGEAPQPAEHGALWLAAERSGDGWGYCRRDEPSIPITAIVRLLVPALRDERSAAWLRQAWTEDLASPVQLSYKAAWYLLARGDEDEDGALAARSLELLIADQREDGGWGPWREHPAPSDCLATGIAMWATASQPGQPRTAETLHRAIAWCESQRLDDGLFPTHFIEEGSAWIHLGWSASLRHLAAEELPCAGS